MTKIYTKKGDEGNTSLPVWSGIKKDAPVIGVLGEIDELNSWLGVFNISYYRRDVYDLVLKLQNDLLDLGAAIAENRDIKENYIDYLERQIDLLDDENEPLDKFVLPGGSTGAAQMHYARAICRRVERSLVYADSNRSLATRNGMGGNVLKYFNRLSDLCFVLARNINRCEEIKWENGESDE
jgi:cob(I)alamin adenosyltransferase